MSLPSITVTHGPDGALCHPPGAHAWFLGTAGEEISLGLIDTKDAQARARHALSLGASPAARRSLRAAEVALHEAHRHFADARRELLH